MAETLSSVRDRLDRATQHLDGVKTLLRQYYAEEPWVLYGETDFYANFAYERVFYVEAPEERLNTVIGEMPHDLRSGLDHLADIFVRTSGGDPGQATYFPACKTPPRPNRHGVRSALLSRCRSDDMLRFLDGVQPYALGALYFMDGLWLLHRLAIIDRHRHIIPRRVALTKLNWSQSGIPPTKDESEWDAHTIRSDEYGAELELRLKTPSPDVEGNATLQLVVQEPGPEGIDNPDPVPLLDLLINVNDKTRAIVDEARASFFG
jgi:hypothetical protein